MVSVCTSSRYQAHSQREVQPGIETKCAWACSFDSWLLYLANKQLAITIALVYTVDSRYSGSLKYGHLDIPAIWLGTEC